MEKSTLLGRNKDCLDDVKETSINKTVSKQEMR